MRWPFPAGAALITGASSGIGEGFARALARQRMALLLVALPQDETRLCALAAELAARHGIRVETVALDLTERDAPHRLQQQADALAFEPDLLINNAGIGVFGPLAEVPVAHQEQMVRLNVEALVALTGLYLPRMVARRHGAILNVASTGAFQPLPYQAVYAASKAFIVRFSEALWAETHRHGVRVIALCPGPVAGTRFNAFAYVSPTVSATEVRQIPLPAVIRTGLNAIARDQPVATLRVAGGRPWYFLYQLMTICLPHRSQLRLMERVARRHLQLGQDA